MVIVHKGIMNTELSYFVNGSRSHSLLDGQICFILIIATMFYNMFFPSFEPV